jgi:hypothetical protein
VDQAHGPRPRQGAALHGGPGIGHDYLEAMESFLPEAGIEMYYYDQLGVNFSDQPKDLSLWTLERYCEELEEVRRGLGLDNFVLYGHSWGGILAMEYALKYQQHLRGCRTALKSILPHFRCRLGGSTRRKSLYPSSLGTVYRPFGRSRVSGSAVRGLMDATPVCSMGWHCATVSRLHRKCGRTNLSTARHLASGRAQKKALTLRQGHLCSGNDLTIYRQNYTLLPGRPLG